MSHTHSRANPIEEFRGRRAVRRVRIIQRRDVFGHIGVICQYRASLENDLASVKSGLIVRRRRPTLSFPQSAHDRKVENL
jgi:hypothetical protein